MTTRPDAQPGDVFALPIESIDRHLIYQVVRPARFKANGFDSADLLLLEGLHQHPDRIDLDALPPARQRLRLLDQRRVDELFNVSGRVPPTHRLLGHRPLLTAERVPCAYGAYDSLLAQCWFEHWRAQEPAELRARREGAAGSTLEVSVGGLRLRENTERLSAEQAAAVPDLAELQRLPRLSTLQLDTPRPDLLPFLRTAPVLGYLDLRQPVPGGALDLREATLHHLSVNAGALQQLALNPSLSSLALTGDVRPDLDVQAHEQGRHLTLIAFQTMPVLPGLRRLGHLVLHDVAELDLATVAGAYPELRRLEIRGQLGALHGFKALERLPQLEVFWCIDLFGYGPADLPDFSSLPALDELLMNGLPKDAGEALKKQLKRHPGIDRDIKGLRDAEWLAANRDNPFRDWDQREAIGASRAAKAARIYRDARQAVLALGQQPAAALQAGLEQAARDFAAAFNRLDGKHGFIETEERETIWDAWLGLQALHPTERLDAPRIAAAFDAVRDW